MKLSSIGFRGRLVAAMIALVVLVSVIIGALFMVYLFEDEKNRARQQLDIGERVTSEVIQRRTGLQLSRLEVVIRDFGFRSAIASGDADTIASALANQGDRAGADLAYLLNTRGELLASSGSDAMPDIPENWQQTARERGIARVLTVIDGQGYEFLAVPVEGPGLRAWLLAGFAIDDELAGIIARLSGVDVMFRARDHQASDFQVFSTTLAADNSRQQELASAAGHSDFTDNAHFFTRITTLDDATGVDLQAILLISREATLQRYYERAREIAMLVAAILVFAALLALLVARNLGGPVLRLAQYARAIGDGKTPSPPAIRSGGELGQLRFALQDMLTKLREREAQIRFAASHDEVTGLANRNALLAAIRDIFRERVTASLIGFRISDLANINDTLGLEFGDKVLVRTAERLRTDIPDANLLARSTGGEFLALLPAQSQQQLDQIADGLRQAIEAPLDIDGTPFSLRTTLVTLQLPEDARNTNELRRRLNLTFEQARHAHDTIVHYRTGQDESHLRELRLIADLHAALRNGDLHMQYQPKLEMASGRLKQVEALIRWNHPELGFVSPEEFIFLAERSGQIHSLTAFILQRVARDARHWRENGLTCGVAVNLSAMDLVWPALADHVAGAFANWDGGLENVTLEVTESAILEEPEIAVRTLDQLKALGVTLSVDDFGTGYSSLSQLRTLPVGELKIDKSFILKLESEPQDQLIVKSTIDMAHGLGLRVVAEGIESLKAWALLQHWGCDLGQGFYLSRPVNAEALPEVAAVLASRHQELAQLKAETSR